MLRLSLPATLCLACALTGQSGSAKTLTDLGVFGDDAGLTVLTDTVSANTPVTVATPVTAVLDQVLPSGGKLYARTRGTFRSLAGLPALRIYESGEVVENRPGTISRVGTTSGSGSSAMPGPRSYLIEFNDTPNRRFYVQVRMRSSAADPSFTAVARVDVGNDGSFEWTQGFDGQRHVVNLPFLMGAAGSTEIKIEVEALASSATTGSSSYSAQLDVGVESIPDDSGIPRNYGTTCGPQTFIETWVLDQQRYLISAMFGAPANAPAFLALGFSEQTFPFPGTNCDLYLVPRWVFPLPTDRLGRVIIYYPAIPSGVPLNVFFQHAAVDGQNNLLLTNGTELELVADSGAPFDFFDINHVLSTGQSLSIGFNGGPATSTTQPFANQMFTSGICGAPSTTLTSLVESGVETHHSAMANLVTDLAETEVFAGETAPRDTHQLLMSCHGRAGWDYAGLARGGAPYRQGMAQVRNAMAAAAAANKTYAVRAVTLVHGESDHQQNNTQYDANLLQLQLDYQRDLKAMTGNTKRVPLIHSQISAWTRQNSTTSPLAMLQLKASVERPQRIPLVGPKYHLDYSDGLHLASNGYRQMGEHYARVYRHVVLEGGTWEPLRPVHAARTGAVVDVRFHVPEPPLVLDTTRVTDPGDYGFEFVDDSGSTPAIQSVQLIEEDTVRITLASAPTGANQSVRYAYTGVLGNDGGPTSGPRGNLRDSDPTPSRHGHDLYNWCVHFEMAVQ